MWALGADSKKLTVKKAFMKKGNMNIGYLILKRIMIKFFNIATIFKSLIERHTKAYTYEIIAFPKSALK